MKTWIITTFVLCALAFNTDARYELKGTITDGDGESLIGASILLKGTATGTVTDIDGNFTLSSRDSCHTAQISYTGFQTLDIELCQGTAKTIALQEDAARLDEVVVIGYGKDRPKRRDRRRAAARASAPMTTSPPPPPPPAMRQAIMRKQSPEPVSAESYATIKENDFVSVATEKTTTFAIDVDAAAYSNVRRFLNEGQLPPADAVRSEEMINYFQFNYPLPAPDTQPFEVTTEVATCPWNPKNQLLLVGVRAAEIPKAQLPPANFVFLLDVSGSMGSPNSLPLLVESLKMLTDNLRAEDQVSIVVYAGASGLVLEPTSGADKAKIKDALTRLQAGGSTAGAAGILQAYQVATDNFIPGGNNRVILATDGDFNVGVSDNESLEKLIEEKRESGVFLSVLGFGSGNLQDDKMQILADKGNGNHAYIDQLNEARKVLVSEFGGTLFTVAKDVKLQLEFNPTYVASYRQIGYENRALANEDFRNDAKDAGELGVGHTVTALYEITPSQTVASTDAAAILRLRYKQPDGDTAQELAYQVTGGRFGFGQSSTNLRWAAAVAEFAMLLRNSEHRNAATYAHCRELAEQALGRDPFGYRREMIDLLEKAESLTLPTEASSEE